MLPFLCLLLLVSAYLLFRQTVRNGSLAHALEDVQKEQVRAFDFLDGLGNQLQKSQSTATMHRFMVEGLVQVLECDGAALHILDPARAELVPMMISPACPLLFEVPAPLLSGSAGQAERLNYLRLQTIPVSHPVYGEALRHHHSLWLNNLAEHPRFSGAPDASAFQVELLIAPLVYAEKIIGLLTAARQRPGRPFNQNDRSVFESLTRQSSFALGSAMVHREASEKRRLDAELRTASEFQRILLPAKAPEFRGYTIAAASFPAMIVSGDYYDYVSVDDRHLGVAIADVAGKGVPASLIMATCRSVLRTRAAGELSPARVLSVVNRQIFPDIREDMFITMTYLVLDAETGHLLISRAGHRPALIHRKATGLVEPVAPVGLAVGIDDGDVFERVITDRECLLEPGDTMLLYTDGLTEAVNAAGEEYGGERLGQSLQLRASEPVESIMTGICEDVRGFAGSEAQSDDITLIVIKKG
ncbi:MAG: SpoIIE family protein phosphatase [Verrucomicrobia bacterium]|nr:SpoIIE family protein phosphatase [Verrucomicrobiota bacterium]